MISLLNIGSIIQKLPNLVNITVTRTLFSARFISFLFHSYFCDLLDSSTFKVVLLAGFVLFSRRIRIMTLAQNSAIEANDKLANERLMPVG